MSDPMIGQTLDGKYRLEELIGEGGMGTVYRALHSGLQTARAVKVMKRALAEDEAFVARFEKEARLAEGLRHPALVTVHDLGRLPDGTPYIVSELVEGDTLARLLRQGRRFPPEEVARLLGQIAQGLAEAHRKGIVHRDIAPDNIMITRRDDAEPAARLLDFGIAKDLATVSSPTTGSSLVLGKLGYAAPEQMGALPEGGLIDSRADVFSLSVVAFEMLTGELPWHKDSFQSYVHDLLMRKEDEVLERVSSRAPGSWHGLLSRGLARDRARRTQDMETLAEEMSSAARAPRGGKPAARQPLRPPSRPGKRSTVIAAGLVAAAVALGLWLKPDVPRQPQSPALGPDGRPPGASLGPTPPGTGDPATLPSATPVASESPPTPAPRALGRLILESSPAAGVTLDGRPRGHTPAVLGSLPPGKHDLVLTSDDGRQLSEVVEVAAGQTLRRAFQFPAFGSLSVVSPSWVEVRIDEGPPQETPVRFPRLAAGLHRVRASRPGYRTQLLEVEIEAGRDRRLVIELEKSP